MKKLVLLLLILLCVDASAQVRLGLRDTYYARLGYTFSGPFSATIEHSLYSEHFINQKARIYFSYDNEWEGFAVSVSPYFSSVWNAQYQDFGAIMRAAVRVIPRCNLDGILNAHFDTQIGYCTCYSFGAEVEVNAHIAVIAHLTNIPEFRMPEKRARIGLSFNVQNLTVSPELSLPLEDKMKTVRVLCGFSFTFEKKQK